MHVIDPRHTGAKRHHRCDHRRARCVCVKALVIARANFTDQRRQHRQVKPVTHREPKRAAPLTPGGIDRVSESAGLQTGEVGANAQSGQATTKVRLDAFGAREMLAIDQVKD